jgi:Zn-dependent protease
MISSSARDNPLNWSFRVGRLFAIDIRLHILFLFGAAYVIYSNAHDAGSLRGAGIGIALTAMLFVIVLVHEFGHCWGARASGGEADEIMLWPLGGLASVRPRPTPRAYFITAAAGPTVNVIFCALTSPILVLLGGGLGAVPWNPLHPFMAVNGALNPGGELGFWLRAFFSLNYLILLFNLLPVYPLDGGRLLHAYLWPRMGRRQATMTATFVGMVGAVVLGLIGFLTDQRLLLTIGVFGYLTCYMDRRNAKLSMDEGGDDAFGYDFSKGYAAFDDAEPAQAKRPGFLERRKLAREIARREREAAEAEQFRERVDEILLKVHREGMKSLTAEERRILEKETERQRMSGSS